MEPKIYAQDSFYTPSGMLDIASDKPLTVAFFGGSLTEGHVDYEGTSLDDSRLKWANVMIKYLSGLFPRRPLKAVNAGHGGTGTEYGAARFYRDVLSHEPDILFIEFSCNDMPHTPADCSEKGRTERQIYLESIIRQSMEARKVPVIIYMHVPLPFEKDVLDRYLLGCRYKQEVLDYYGIPTVDAMADFMREFEIERDINSDFTLYDYYDQYYKKRPSGLGAYDVHPNGAGYLLFAKSLINAIMHAPERFFCRFKMCDTPYRAEFSDQINERYSYVPASSQRIMYKGEWNLYTKDNEFVTEDLQISIASNRFSDAHQFPDGIMQTYMPNGAELEFETDADTVSMPHYTAKAGLDATVYVDGVEMGRLGCRSIHHGMNFRGPVISLPKGRKRVRIVVDDATEDARIFRFGYIIEGFKE